jgi:hypothetical protein
MTPLESSCSEADTEARQKRDPGPLVTLGTPASVRETMYPPVA